MASIKIVLQHEAIADPPLIEDMMSNVKLSPTEDVTDDKVSLAPV
jgi:hypothetical protein